jgi:hypothetical protein
MPKRDYRKEYDRYHASEIQKKRRASRNSARAKLVKSGVKVKGMDVAHKNGNPTDNRRSNLKVQNPSKNRSFARTRTAKKKNPRS